MHLKKLKQQKQVKSKVSIRKEVTNIRAEIIEIENINVTKLGLKKIKLKDLVDLPHKRER